MIELLLYAFLPIVAELTMLGLAIVWAPGKIVKAPNWAGRWLVRIVGVLAIVSLFHARQIAAKVLIASEHPAPLFVAETDAYCEPFGVVSFPNSVVDLDNYPDALPLELPRPKTSSDVVRQEFDCVHCVWWLRTGIASRAFVGMSDSEMRFPYSRDGRWTQQLREAFLSRTAECEANYQDSIWTTGTPAMFEPFAERPLTPIAPAGLDQACISYGAAPDAAPLVIANERQLVTNLPLGLQRVEFQYRLMEHFSQEIIAQSTKVAIYGAAPTFRPDERRQHESVGRLLYGYDLMKLYRDQNCTAREPSAGGSDHG